jgi:hypothetical protein
MPIKSFNTLTSSEKLVKHEFTLFPSLVQVCIILSTLCHDADKGKELLHAAIDALLMLPESGHPESNTTVASDIAAEKPTLLWKALYIQDLTMVCFSSQLFCSRLGFFCCWC